MLNKYTRQEKGKWIHVPFTGRRRSPLRILASDNSKLIEAHKFTLIGRVTNPIVQHRKDVVDYMLQYWNIENVKGKYFGPKKFQFSFATKEDLKAFLRRASYHFKGWMLPVQHWEPVISPHFPSQISFWVRIEEIPTHHWTDQYVRTIGKDLGFLEERDVEQGRVRVRINGLAPL
ncbi:hypothetical protein V5N11_025798 [Cardamine amara subsp. amara]|uniref:DUF4283 domain-containing protein n=1 Tax=Cardamine amara subsp. amara TaxID=228776 RepID=A0ABD0ZBD9_CARAN